MVADVVIGSGKGANYFCCTHCNLKFWIKKKICAIDGKSYGTHICSVEIGQTQPLPEIPLYMGQHYHNNLIKEKYMKREACVCFCWEFLDSNTL